MLELGNLYMTAGVNNSQDITMKDIYSSLARYVLGDWGDVEAEDKAANDEAVAEGFRVLASYISKAGERFWILMEADRSYTTIL